MITKWLKKILMSVLLIGMALPLFGARPMTRQELEDQQLREFLQGFSPAQPQAQPVRLRPASRAQFMEAPDQRPAVVPRQARSVQRPAQLSEEEELERVLALSAAEAEEKEAAIRPGRPVRKNYALVIEVADVPADQPSMDNFQAFLKNQIVKAIKDANLGKGISVYPFVPKLRGSGKSYHHFTFLMMGAQQELQMAELKREILKALNEETASNRREIEGNHLVDLHSTDGLEARIVGKSQYVVLHAPVPRWLETMAQAISAQLGVLGLDVGREHFELYGQGGKVYQPHVTMLSIVDKNKQLPEGFLPSQIDQLNKRAAKYNNPFVRGSKVIGQLNAHRISLTLKEGHDIIPQAVFIYDPITHKWREGR